MYEEKTLHSINRKTNLIPKKASNRFLIQPSLSVRTENSWSSLKASTYTTQCFRTLIVRRKYDVFLPLWMKDRPQMGELIACIAHHSNLKHHTVSELEDFNSWVGTQRLWSYDL